MKGHVTKKTECNLYLNDIPSSSDTGNTLGDLGTAGTKYHNERPHTALLARVNGVEEGIHSGSRVALEPVAALVQSSFIDSIDS